MTAAVLDGVLTPAQAAVLTRLVGKIDPDALAESQPNLIAVAATMDPAQLGHWVSHQIATHCEPAFEAEQERAHAKRYLTHRRDDDGSLFGRFRLSAEDSEAFLTALEPLARRNQVLDTRTAGQRRADALVVMSEQVLRHGELGDAGGLRPQLSYVLPADWAAGRHAEATCTSCGPRCADHQPLTFGDTVQAAMPGQGGIRAEQACATAAWTGPQTRARIETPAVRRPDHPRPAQPPRAGHRLPTPAGQRHPSPTPQPRRPRPRLRRPRLHPTTRHVRRPPRPRPC